MRDMRFLEAEDKFLKYSYIALKTHFARKKEFNEFYDAITQDEDKNLFLKTASFYLLLVKRGDWLIKLPGVNKRIDYLTDTYKYIAIFSLIESLHREPFIEFYEYLVREKSNITFPIKDKEELSCYFRKYKSEFGSIQQSMTFFKSLAERHQSAILKKLEITDSKATIEDISKYLYEVRSQFVHEAKLIVNMSGTITVSKHRNKSIISKLSLEDLMLFFEQGLITYFKNRQNSRNRSC
jgi:hypothetical protein